MADAVKKRIKFCCEHCDQLLSIGTSRIGRTIDCPKCGETLTVPNETEAGEQLAGRKTRRDAHREEHGEDFSQFTVYDDATEFIFESEDDSEGYYGGRIDRSKVAVPRMVLYVQGGLLGAVAIGCFLFGWVFGALTSGERDVVEEDNTPRIVRGTVNFLDTENRTQPDAGSVVILVPEDRRPGPDEKVDAVGLRPDDAPPDPEIHPGLQRIKVLGGAYARTDAEGQFRLHVPKRGRYFMLIISANSKRSGGQEVNREHLAQMGRYFVPATDLIGQSQFRWTEEPIARDQRVDYTFGG